MKNQNGTIFANISDYADHYLSIIDSANLLSYTDKILATKSSTETKQLKFGKNVILNDYELFSKETCNIIRKKSELHF